MPDQKALFSKELHNNATGSSPEISDIIIIVTVAEDVVFDSIYKVQQS